MAPKRMDGFVRKTLRFVELPLEVWNQNCETVHLISKLKDCGDTNLFTVAEDGHATRGASHSSDRLSEAASSRLSQQVPVLNLVGG